MSKTKSAVFSRAVAAIVACSALVLPLQAYDLITGPDGALVTWDNGTIPIVIRMASTPTLQDGSNYATSVQAAALVWNAQLQRVQFSTQLTGAGYAGSANGLNEIAFDRRIYSNELNSEAFGENTLAVTISYRSESPREDGSYRRTTADVLFNTAFTWNSYRGGLQNPEDIRRVAIHELGHVLGLAHPDQDDQAVTAIMNSTVTYIDAVQTDDINGAQFLYGRPGGFTAPENDAFANAVAVNNTTLSATVYGSSIGATKESGEPNHADGEPGGASVWWKWTAPTAGLLTVRTAGSFFDTLLAAYTGTSVSALTQLAANDDAGTNLRTSQISVHVASGVTYYFAVDGWDGQWGQITLQLDFQSVTGGIPPSFASQPSDRTVTDGQTTYFMAVGSGTPSPTYQWQRRQTGSETWVNLINSSDIVGATSSMLQLHNTTMAMSGDTFRCVLTNASGVATSNVVALTVTASAPSILQHLQNQEVLQGGSVTFTVGVNGTPPFTYVWTAPNGQVIAGATTATLALTNAQTSGYYQVRVSNPQGSAFSTAYLAVVTPPVFTSEPVDVTLYEGDSLRLGVYTSQPGTFTFQWTRNGVVLPGATSNEYSAWPVALSHAGIYTVTMSNLAGSITSREIEVVVLPRPAPRNVWIGRETLAGLGDSVTLSNNGDSLWGNGLTYQWFKNGVPIPGATSSSHVIAAVTPADYADYFLTVTNSVGTGVSNTLTLRYTAKKWQTHPQEWVASADANGIVYFLFADTPRLERYNLATESWLPAYTLATAPKALAVADDAIYLADAQALRRLSLDLSSNQTIYEHADVRGLLVRGNHLLIIARDSYADVAYRTLDRTTNAIIAEQKRYYGADTGPLFLWSTGRVYLHTFLTSPSDLHALPWNADGTFGNATDSPYHGNFNQGYRNFAASDGQSVIADNGLVYAADTMQVRSGIGGSFDELALAPGGDHVVIRGGRLFVYDTAYREKGSRTLSVNATRVVVRSDMAFCFARPATAGGRPAVQKAALSSAVERPAASVVSPVGRKVWSPAVTFDGLGNVFVHSKLEGNVFRWSANEGAYLASLPLRGHPDSIAAAAELGGFFYERNTLDVRRLHVNGTAQTDAAFVGLPRDVQGILAVGRNLIVADSGYQHGAHSLFSPAGSRLFRRETSNVSRGTAYWWDAVGGNLLYSAGQSVDLISVAADGNIGVRTTLLSINWTSPPPLRASPDGSQFVMGSGRVAATSPAAWIGNLQRRVVDAAWTNGKLHTVSEVAAGTRLTRWSGTWAVEQNATFPGVPLALHTLADGNLVLVTHVAGDLVFRVLAPATLGGVPASYHQGAPVLVRPPAAQEVGAGGTASFSVVARGGAGLSYQWRRNGAALQDGGRFIGSQSQVLLIQGVTSSEIGTYDVVVSNGSGSFVSPSASLGVPRQQQTLSFGSLLSSRSYTAQPIALNLTSSSGLAVAVEVVSGPGHIAGGALTLTGVGTVVLKATQAGDQNYAPAETTHTLQVSPATVAVSLTASSAVYDGTAKQMFASTTPVDLPVAILYNGVASPPINAGQYSVAATVTDPRYTGSAQAVFVISKANQTITFAGPADRSFSGHPLALVATASSGLPVSFSVTGGAAEVWNSSLWLTGVGTVFLRASQAGDGNYHPAPSIERAFSVSANFASWQYARFSEDELAFASISGPAADPDGDGHANLLEYALGLDPRAPDGAVWSGVMREGDDWYFTYDHPVDRTDIVYAVEVSPDLQQWTEESVTHEWVATEGDRDTWRARHPRSSGPLFFRLKVTVP